MAKISTVQFKRGTAAALTKYLIYTESENRRLLSGEPAFETDTGKLKVGDGQHDYADLKYVDWDKSGGGGSDDRFVIVDPKENQILLYDDESKKWVNKYLSEEEKIIYLDQNGFSLQGFEDAEVGQMLTKGSDGKLSWKTPVTTTELDAKVAEANKSAANAKTSEDIATSKVAEIQFIADTTKGYAEATKSYYDGISQKVKDAIDEKFQVLTVEEYNALEEIKADCYYFITL